MVVMDFQGVIQAQKYNNVMTDLITTCTMNRNHYFGRRHPDALIKNLMELDGMVRCELPPWPWPFLGSRGQGVSFKKHQTCLPSVMADHFDLRPLVMSTGARLPYLTINTKAATVESVKALLSYGHKLAESFVSQLEVEDEHVAVVKFPLGPDVSACLFSPPYWAMAIGGQYAGVGHAGPWDRRRKLAKVALALHASQHLSDNERNKKLVWLFGICPSTYEVFHHLLHQWKCTMDQHVNKPPYQWLEDPQKPEESDPLNNLAKRDSTGEVWGPSVFKVVHSFSQQTGNFSGETYLALGELVCDGRYIMLEALICNQQLQKAPLQKSENFDSDVSYLTLAKLGPLGDVERVESGILWKSEGKQLNLSKTLEDSNDYLKSSGLPYKLIPVDVEKDDERNSYHLIGGAGRHVCRMIQDLISATCEECLGRSIERWSSDPWHPHITHYRSMSEEPQIAISDINESTGNDSFDSLEYSLQKLDEIGLPQYKNLFQREGLSRSALPYLEHELLERIGVSRLGDRIKILQLKGTAKSR